ncbi:mRNA-decapping enzyme subunit 2 [Talaromyces islandicus]|uniref:mRNA-decapping enzyme subunit 2 n=1 Tax=Talaromyces islandicus TaxID=28573 RepID=A0A0U1M4X8_TALIS|nr:mRNA-decapping enzyme subunit 2 [Talaromyces islandicus]
MTETRLSLEDSNLTIFGNSIGLDDLCVRFIINLPREELESVERICFQVEEAQWFYEDFIRPLDPALPSLSLKAFAMRIFQHCPLMSQWSEYHHTTAFSEFLAYKTRVPVRGAIMLNETMDKVVLVKGWKKNANWSFPRGKINKEEKDLDCAVREVLEETGYDLKEAGLVKEDKQMKYIEITMREQHMKLYVFRGVPMDTQFAPQTRKEISKIEWVNLSDLPTVKKNKQAQNDVVNANKFYMVAPFLHPLKKWIAQQRKLDAKNYPTVCSLAYTEGETSMDEGFVSANNGFGPSHVYIQPGTASDLPEVSPPQDVSSHLKRLLNIGPSASIMQPSPPASATTDPSKSNALLSLLRNGSSETATQGMPEPTAGVPEGFVHLGSSTHQQPVFHQPPGILNQQVPSRGHMQADRSAPYLPHQQIPQAPAVSNQPFGIPNQYAPAPPPSRNWNASVSEQRLPGSDNRVPQPRNEQQHVPPFHARPQPMVAPYQQTGDPQFAQQTNAAPFQGSTIPPASKLPPPKLTSHSLALLNVFKTQSPTPKAATMSQQGTRQSTQPKPLPPQDNLLALLKGSAHKPSPMPAAELAAQPVQTAPVQILQRPPSSKKEASNVKANNLDDDTLTSATVSGPLKTPEFGQKGFVKQETNRPRANKKPPVTASPITILPRPSAAKRDSSVSSEQISRPSSRAQVDKTKPADASKGFQPQILRRSEKLDLNNVLPTRTIPVHELSQPPNPYAPVNKVPTITHDKPMLPKYDRRPSQTAAQKETLLNLFGKSPSDRASHMASAMDRPASRGHFDAISSPSLSGVESNIPANVSRLGSPSENGTTNSGAQRFTSPDNKAFLLGFLQNVAQGKK